MQRLIIFGLLGLTVTLSFLKGEVLVSAQTPVPGVTPLSSVSMATSTALRCSQFFILDAIKVTGEEGRTAELGKELSIPMVIENTLEYPLVEVTVAAKIFKRSETGSFDPQRDEVIDQFIVTDRQTLAPKSNTPFTFLWQVPTTIKQGEYYVGYFLYTKEGQPISGDFTSDVDFAGTTPFTVPAGGDPDKAVRFEKTEATLNGKAYDFAASARTVGRNETVTLGTTLKNTSTQEKQISVQWQQYARHALSPEQLRFTKTDLVTLAPGEEKRMSYTVVGQLESEVHVVAQAQDFDTKSVLNFRLVRDGGFETKLLVAGLTKFPLDAGDTASVFACATAPFVTPINNTTLELTLKDEAGNLLAAYGYGSALTHELDGFAKDFTVDKRYDTLVLSARLLQSGGVVEEFTRTYDCALFNPSLCGNDQVERDEASAPSLLGWGIGGGFLLLGAFGVWWYRQRSRTKIPPKDTMTVPTYK